MHAPFYHSVLEFTLKSKLSKVMHIICWHHEYLNKTITSTVSGSSFIFRFVELHNNRWLCYTNYFLRIRVFPPISFNAGLPCIIELLAKDV